MLSRWFWPSKNNQYHPCILRVSGVSIMLALIAVQPLAYNLIKAHRLQLIDYATDITTSELLDQTNQQRQANGVAPLSDNAKLDSAAGAKAADMFAKDYWAHNSPTGETPWDFITAAGYSYSAAGENLAMDFSTTSGVIAGWMGSPEHRANMLNATYKDVGFAVMNGTLTGENTTLVVAEYGAPLNASPAPAKTVPSRPSTPAPAPVAAQQPAQPVPAATPSQSPPAAKPVEAAPKPVNSTTAPATEVTKPVSLSLAARFNNIDTLNWGQSVTVFLLFVLLLANILKHTIVWRKQKRGWRHIWMRAHPAFQAGLLSVGIIAVVASSFGVIQ